MKSTIKRVIAAALMLLFISCSRIMEEDPLVPEGPSVPDGTPITMMLNFGGIDRVELNVGTKAEASIVEETHVNDIYVLIFNTKLGDPDYGKKIYGRYFGYEHHISTIAELESHQFEGWFVENKSITNTEVETKGAVKISTKACSDATIVVIANVKNSVLTFNGDPDGVAFLNQVDSWSGVNGFYETQVVLAQDVVARTDVFLKMGYNEHVNTGNLSWGELGTPPNYYGGDNRISLRSLDAKVKVRVSYNTTNISEMDAVYWHANNIPDRCYLFPHIVDGVHVKPVSTQYFDTDDVYFDGIETDLPEDPDDPEDKGKTWSIFTFYMLENCHEPSKLATSYYQREKKVKEDLPAGQYGNYSWTTVSGEPPVESDPNTGLYVRNKEWEYANDHATYVDFDLVLTLTKPGIEAATGAEVNNALTTDAVYTMHLGDFTSSATGVGHDYNNYETLRNHSYTYNITVNNSESIFVEVKHDEERQAGQEGSLLLTSDEIVNADCHYEYHSISFKYNGDLSDAGLTWFVKTPFGSGQPHFNSSTRRFEGYEDLDYLWVKYAINDVDPVSGYYRTERKKYPGDAPGNQHYFPDWVPDTNLDVDDSGLYADQLLDINQLILLLYDQSRKRFKEKGNLYITEGTGVDAEDYLRVTAYIDEYYYEKNPFTGEVDKDLWRRFVNAKPREMHILSDAQYSRDRQSDVIKSSHSIIQASIQTIYNLYSPGLRSLWGTEHKDEIKEKLLMASPTTGGWTLWPDGQGETGSDPERHFGDPGTAIGRTNGRLNTAYSWGLRDGNGRDANDITNKQWDTFLNYEVNNNTPELISAAEDDENHVGYEGMIYSCLSRNRDNNGDGYIDRDEVRWYMAASEQLVGMFVGNEALSLSARLYQPAQGEWRAHIISSTGGNLRVLWAEEGAALGAYDREKQKNGSEHTWEDYVTAAHGESVRCLRNIGTYDNAGVVTDITGAEYNQEVDEYYTFTSTGSGSNTQYTFDFSRLNSKCIREYTAGELPYHDQMSMNNRLYAKMVTQKVSESASVEAFSVKHQTINPSVAAGGHNKYCPPGYRFPNMSEALMLYNSKVSNFYGSNNMPTRTYYDRGFYGALKSDPASADPEPWSVEYSKIGWTISSDGSIHANGDVDITNARCVRDENMTGVIEGEILLNDNVLCAEDYSTVIFNFSSRASALSYATLKLCYTNSAGNYREIDIPIENPHGVQYREPVPIDIPSLAFLGLEEGDLPRRAILQAEVHNVGGEVLVATHDVTIDEPLTVDLQFPSLFNETTGLPARPDIKVHGHGHSLTSATLYWRKDDEAWYEQPIDINDIEDFYLGVLDSDFATDMPDDRLVQTVEATKDRSDKTPNQWEMPNAETPDNKEHQSVDIYTSDPGPTYYFYVKATIDGDTEHPIERASDVSSMQIIRYNYTPNPPDPVNGWSTIIRQDINHAWFNTISDVNLANGDFIETLMDVSECVFVDKLDRDGITDGPAEVDLGLDNVFAFGTNRIDWNHTSIQFYYPAEKDSRMQLLFHPIATTGNTGVYCGELSGELALRVSYEGLYINGNLRTGVDKLNDAITTMRGTSSFMVGSREGIKQSRATYKYVRVVRKGYIPSVDANTDFGPGPQDGGSM